MLFNSVAFLVFFPVVTGAFFGLPTGRSRILLLLLASCFFYMAFIPQYILILILTICVDYAAGLLIGGATRYRRLFLLMSIATNVAVLATFKYYAFLSGNFSLVGGLFGSTWQLPALNIVLPIGLSFHTFQAMSYTIEVYYGRQEPERDFLVYSLYVMFYPQLVAGPIERPQNLLPQFHQPHRFDYQQAASGLRRMAWGLFKKIVVADRLAALVDLVYDDLPHYHGLALMAATVMFAFQIYFDFSAYSDIALGAARVMGFTLMENFRTPYFSRSVAEFWRRWHISLSTWFKDYVYIPLGGSRTSRGRRYRNVLVVFVLSGLWHGAGWTFILWGALHGVYLVVGDLTGPLRANLRGRLGLKDGHLVMEGLACLGTFSLVTFAWIFFRVRTLDEGLYVVRNMFAGLGTDLVGLMRGDRFPLAGVVPRLALVSLVVAIEKVSASWTGLDLWLTRMRLPVRYGIYLALIYGTIFGHYDGSAQQFIYFQF